jgi:hypothetical protein
MYRGVKLATGLKGCSFSCAALCHSIILVSSRGGLQADEGSAGIPPKFVIPDRRLQLEWRDLFFGVEYLPSAQADSGTLRGFYGTTKVVP